ncbi:23S rRNA (adenine(2030)-N(6))-methyltransferase RlmJ [Porticoccus sp.]
MLSYRHGFHAGNFADVLKHIVLVDLLDYLTQKDKPFEYIDSHAGAGLYKLSSPQANKTAEYEGGISRLEKEDFPELGRYLSLVGEACNGNGTRLSHYPGSPWFARRYLRERDRAWLYEAHPTDFAVLEKLMDRDSRVRCQQEDGFQGLLSHLPPTTKRGLVLIDPSYEVKSDYQQVVDYLIKAHRKFPSGVFALWYPVVDRARIDRLTQKLVGSGIRRIQLFELAVQADSNEHGMTASGMIVINPPWTQFERMQQLLPKLLSKLDQQDGFYRCEQLAGE